MKNPWLVEGREDSFTIVAEDRIREIQSSHDITWLRQVLSYPDNQLTVRQAAERRLRKLMKPQPRSADLSRLTPSSQPSCPPCTD